MSIRSILKKRNEDFIISNKNIVELYGDKIIKALRFYTKTERDIQLRQIDFHGANSNFIIIIYVIPFNVGDVITSSNGKKITITDEIIKIVKEEKMHVILPVEFIEDASSIDIFEKIKFYDEFIIQHGLEQFNKCIESGMKDITDVLTEHDDLLEELTDPSLKYIEKMDNIQKIEYNYYLKNKVIN